MAKQTFTVGQVLTASQLTNLQQTALGGGSATAKTASYVLVAADAGTTVIMNSASATTITVNTSLFAAGDTVYIQNLGAGVCTITAGTATVNTSATLALAQYEGGQLYFTSTSASLFIKGAGGSAGSFTSIASGTLSGTALALASIPQTFKNLVLFLNGITVASGSTDITLYMNSNTASAYRALRAITSSATWTSAVNTSAITLVSGLSGSNRLCVNFENYAAGTGFPNVQWQGMGTLSATQNGYWGFGTLPISATLSTINIDSSTSLTGGTYALFGVN